MMGPVIAAAALATLLLLLHTNLFAAVKSDAISKHIFLSAPKSARLPSTSAFSASHEAPLPEVEESRAEAPALAPAEAAALAAPEVPAAVEVAAVAAAATAGIQALFSIFPHAQ